jgi:hypothetical protein
VVDPTETFEADIDLGTRVLLGNCCPKMPEQSVQMQDSASLECIVSGNDGTAKEAGIGAIELVTTALAAGAATAQRTGSGTVEKVEQAGCGAEIKGTDFGGAGIGGRSGACTTECDKSDAIGLEKVGTVGAESEANVADNAL